MNCSAEQVVNGIIKYADAEVINKLPTSGKWIVGTGIGLASNKVANVIEVLKENAVVRMLGIIDDSGCIDVDALTASMKASADKYGKLTVEVPLVGRMSFTASDIDTLRNHILM